MLYELPEYGTDVPKHAGIVRDYMDMFVMCAFVWFCK
jgi:hypothetical protein